MQPAITNKTSLSDLPYLEDVNDFGTERYVNGLIKFIENSSAPLTIALQGEWGSGKTSLMTRLERHLCSLPDSRFIGIEINSWEHSMLSTPEATVYKILLHLVNELAQDDADSKKKFRSFLRGAGNFLYRGARESLKTIPGVGGVLAVGLEAANIPTQLLDNNTDDYSRNSLADLKKSLGEAVQKSITKANKKGVIIFVDDLDRLNPPVAVEILELLKNIFTLDNCIFVLAIDYDVVVKGLRPKFGELTEKNEREFRSFFDKIIQVPFSLPVSNYRPMDFVLKSLVDIGYINNLAVSNPQVREQFTNVVNASVGKNPRSIKRLINTLSLLDCIARCGGEPEGDDDNDNLDDRLLNFIIVSIQICYPKIYRMLSNNPCFTSWDMDFTRKMGIKIDVDCEDETDEDEDDSLHWKDIVKAACLPDPYLTQHLNDINRLFELITDITGSTSQEGLQGLAKKMKKIMDKSSVTGLNPEFKAEEFDKNGLMKMLHPKIKESLLSRRPDIIPIKRSDNKHAQRHDIDTLTLKRTTENGGMYIRIGGWGKIDVTLSPKVSAGKKIQLVLTIKAIPIDPRYISDSDPDESTQETWLSDRIQRLQDDLALLLNDRRNNWYLKGGPYGADDTYYDSFTDEFRHLHDKLLMAGDMNNGVRYTIELDEPSQFEDNKVSGTIADVLIAFYDFGKNNE